MNEDIDSQLNPLDAPPLDALDDAFALPEPYADDERIVRWHTEIVTRLRREAAGIPMTTAQTMLMERIAFFYVVMRYKEFNEGGISPRELKDNNSAFLSMLDSFNKLLEKHNDKVIGEMMGKVMGILSDRMSMITDATERQALRRALAEDFQAEGM